jgi:hypothetical protein
MKLAIKLLIAYEAIGFLTLLYWLFVGLDGLTWTGPYNRIVATIVFGPCVFLGWPTYWWDIDLGPWLWLAAAFAVGYLDHAAKIWLRKIGTPGPMPRGVGRNLSSF